MNVKLWTGKQWQCQYFRCGSATNPDSGYKYYDGKVRWEHGGALDYLRLDITQSVSEQKDCTKIEHNTGKLSSILSI